MKGKRISNHSSSWKYSQLKSHPVGPAQVRPAIPNLKPMRETHRATEFRRACRRLKLSSKKKGRSGDYNAIFSWLISSVVLLM